MAQNSLLCTDVPLRNYSLTHTKVSNNLLKLLQIYNKTGANQSHSEYYTILT